MPIRRCHDSILSLHTLTRLSRRPLLTWALAGTIALPVAGYAQTSSSTGAVSGAVHDSTSAVVPNAVVTIVNDQTRVATKVNANEGGNYSIPYLTPGTYTLSVSAPGFKSYQQRGIIVDVSVSSTANVELGIGSSDETITVTSQAPLLQTEQTTLDTTVSTKFVDDLPQSANGGTRDAIALIGLTPGASGSRFGANVAGGLAFENEVLLDGVPIIYDPVAPVPLSNKPDQDIISEVHVQTGVPDAQYGHTSGGLIEETTRSGTNQLHGQARIFLHNTVLDATPYNATTKPTDQQFELPLSIGGPVIFPHLYNGKDKTFFFFNYSAFRTHSSNLVETTTVPTDAERNGDFSALLLRVDANGKPDPQVIYDPQTGKPFPNNQIPANRISAVSAAYLKFIPAPTNSAIANNYNSTTPQSNKEDHYFARIDHNFANRNQLFGNFRWDKVTIVNADGPFGALLSTRNGAQLARTLALEDNWIIRSSLVNHAVLAYSRWTNTQTGTPPGTFQQIKGSYGNDFPTVAFSNQYLFGSINGAANIIGDPNTTLSTNPFWHFEDIVSLDKGKHSLKFGFRHDRYGTRQLYGGNSNGQPYTFNPTETAGGQNNAGDAFASYLLGLVDSVSLSRDTPGSAGSTYNALFAQDTYKVTPKFVVNYGVRWEYQTPYTQGGANDSVVDLTVRNPTAGNRLGATIFAGNGPGRLGVSSLLPTYYKSVAPRIGFDYSLNATTVIRGGYGILYNLLPLTSVDNGNYAGGSASLSAPTPGVAALQWDAGFPAGSVPSFPTISPGLQNGQSIRALNRVDGQSNKPGYQHVVQLDVQKSIASILFEAGYVGQFAHKLENSISFVYPLLNLNQLPVSTLSLGSILNQPINSAAAQNAGYTAPYPGFTGTVAQSLRAYPQYNNVVEQNGVGQSNYNALLVKVDKRFSNGLQFLVSYSFSKLLSNISGFTTLPAPQDTYNPRAEYSIADTDIPNRLVLSYTYELPVGHGKAFANGGFAGRVLEGFAVSGIQTYQSGTPVEISFPNSLPIFNGTLHANKVPGQPFTINGGRGSIKITNSLVNPATKQPVVTGTQYLNPKAFAAPQSFLVARDQTKPVDPMTNPLVINTTVVANPYTALGSLPYVLPKVRTIGLETENISIFKRQNFAERYTFEIRADFFNAFNRKEFGCLNNDPTSGGFGIYGCNAVSPRSIQMGGRFSF